MQRVSGGKTKEKIRIGGGRKREAGGKKQGRKVGGEKQRKDK